MYRTIVILLLALSTLSMSQAQSWYPSCVRQPHSKYEVWDTVRYIVSYDYSTYRDPELPEMRDSDEVWVEIGDSVTKCYSRLRWLNDSIVQIVMDKGARAYSPLHQWCMHETIFCGYKDSLRWYYQDIMKTRVHAWNEKPATQTWTILEDSKQILGYPCKKATTNYRGRHYTAWYTPDIPLPYGPWTFRGLPGLILEIKDDTNRVSFEAKGFQKARRDLPLVHYSSKEIRTTRENARKLIDYMHRHPYIYMGERYAKGAQWLTPNTSFKHTWVELE